MLEMSNVSCHQTSHIDCLVVLDCLDSFPSFRSLMIRINIDSNFEHSFFLLCFPRSRSLSFSLSGSILNFLIILCEFSFPSSALYSLYLFIYHVSLYSYIFTDFKAGLCGFNFPNCRILCFLHQKQ